MTATLKVPFGLLNGELFEPQSVANGKACGCVCPGCARPLIAYNKGKIRTTQYFGHLPGEECGRGVESALHMAGKEALIRALCMARPELLVGPFGILRPGVYSEVQIRIDSPTRAEYTTVVSEVPLKVKIPPDSPDRQTDLFEPSPEVLPTSQLLRPDLQAVSGDIVDWVEIRVTHAVDQHKQSLLQQAGLRVLEIDLSDFLRNPVDLSDIHKAVVEDVKRKTWISHPGVQAARAAAREKADQLEMAEMRRLELEAKIRNRAPRQWMGDGTVPWPPTASATVPVQVNRKEQHRDVEVEQRRRLGLASDDAWPKHLHLDITGNAGSLVPARLWITQLFLDWVADRERGQYLVSDLVESVSGKFGFERPYGYRDMRQVLCKRVLPYWQACRFIELREGEVVSLTGKAASSRRP